MKKERLLALVSCLALLGLTACAGLQAPRFRTPAIAAVAANASAMPSFAAAVQKACPAIVSISSIVRDEAPDAEASAIDATEEETSQGAGFFIDGKGTLVTAAHVVADARRVYVRLADLRVFEAQVVGLDEDADIAVLTITASVDSPIFGRSQASTPGDWVLAVGDPFGLQNSVVAGIVAGASRHLPVDGDGYFIQSDLALNPGNSGGPLLNAAGDIIGLNLRTMVGPGGTDGVSLSVPIETVLQVAAELSQGTGGLRPRLGATFEDVPTLVAVAAGRTRASGALVVRVAADGAADKLRVQAGDIIVALNDAVVDDSADLSRQLLAWRVLSGSRIVVWRDRRYQLLQLP